MSYDVDNPNLGPASTPAKKVIEERESSHGPWEVQAAIAQNLKNSMIDKVIDPVLQESLDLICTKMSRIVCGDPTVKDHWLDIAGYAQLALNYLEGKDAD